MLGLMQDWPLLVHKILDHAAIYHAGREVVTRSVEGPIAPYGYRDVRRRAQRVCQGARQGGHPLGDRVATLAWNTDRHLETWYGITGIGAIYHTLNPRLFPEQIVYIANHAEDRVLFFDVTFRETGRGARAEDSVDQALCRDDRPRKSADGEDPQSRRL